MRKWNSGEGDYEGLNARDGDANPCLLCRIDAERLTREFNIPPGPIYKELIAGNTITAPDGRVVSPDMVIGPMRPPRKIVILGDTCDPTAIAPHAMDADVLVHEATCADEDAQIALSKGHSTAGMAGEFARRIRAKHLILNHFSPRGFQPNEYEESKAIRTLVQQARRRFQSDFVYAARVSRHVRRYSLICAACVGLLAVSRPARHEINF